MNQKRLNIPLKTFEWVKGITATLEHDKKHFVSTPVTNTTVNVVFA